MNGSLLHPAPSDTSKKDPNTFSVVCNISYHLIQWYCIYWLTGVLRSNTPSSSCMDQKGGKGQTSSSIQLNL
jgi:hypothetical protein